jgi:two-component system sensor histidine kinase PilS (NtrC family)
MISQNSIEEPQEIVLRRIKWLIILRLMLATFSLGTAALIQANQSASQVDPYLISLYVIIGIVYGLSLIYTLILKRVRNVQRVRTFIYTQILLDVLLITGLVNATGGVKSVFSLFYYLSIISASIMLYRRGGVIVASASSLFYGLIVALEYYGFLQPFYGPPKGDVYGISSLLFRVFMNITAFYLIAILSSLLSEQVRKSREALRVKEIDYDKLETLHQNIIESINSGLLTIDKDARITSFNRAAEEITGYKFSEVNGVKIDEILPEMKKVEQNPQKIANNGGRNPRFEISFKRADGKSIYLGFSKSILRDGEEGGIQGEIYAFQDVTRIMEMEEHVKLVDRLAAVGRLAAGMAHEVRNPLASMSGSIQVLRDGLELDADNKRLMEIVLRETNRLDQLLSDFVLFAQPSDRKKEIVELNSIIDDTLQLFLNNPDHTNINVVTNLKGDIMIEADSQQIKQVFWNLFVNAAQAMNGGGELKVSTQIVPLGSLDEKISSILNDNAGMLWSQTVVADTGRGIQEESLDKIFDPFFTTRDQGIGLGLAIVYRIIESYKGIILVESEKYKGSRFVIYLPAIAHHEKSSG